LYTGAFPGSVPGTLGEWVYRLHHHQAIGDLSPKSIAPAALQLLHVAAHVDTILTHIVPILQADGYIILDRYWWSTYSYSRSFLQAKEAWSLVHAERRFLTSLLRPTIIYLSRKRTLKAQEISATRHAELDSYYRELIDFERNRGGPIHILHNDGPIEQTWIMLLTLLDLPYRELVL
jgi:thymidylate kinase